MNKPCEYNRYPHTDINVQNLDWIIEQINDLNHTVDVFTTLNKLTWAGNWNIGEAYSQWSLVNDLEGNGYVSIVPVPRNVQITNTDYWQPVAKYDSLYQAFEDRIAALENFVNTDVPLIEANIQNNADNIISLQEKVTKEVLIDLIYPVGSIYMTMNNDIDPTTFYGGFWEKIEARFLFGSGVGYGDTYVTGDVGGSKDAVCVEHTHNEKIQSNNYPLKWVMESDIGGSGSLEGAQLISNKAESTSTGIYEVTTDSAGETGLNKNMPPYVVVNIWKRIR